MTSRLTEEQDPLLKALAEAEGVGKQEAVIRAIEQKAARMSREELVDRYAEEADRMYAPLLERLAK